MTKLVIVDSPGKIIKLNKFLGAEYKIMASYGHICDLPKSLLGFAAPDYTPEYVVTNPDVVNKLKAAVKNIDEVILATESDRTGEFIAWQLTQVLRLKNPKRVDVQQFAPSEVSEAFKNPRTINDNLARAHEARRVIDRYIGYKLSDVIVGLGLYGSISVSLPWGRYKREIEAGLDHIAQGKATYEAVLGDIFALLDSEMNLIQAGCDLVERGRTWWPYHDHEVH
jgi:DNA topoisomerase IA